MKLFIVRHGETIENEKRILMGHHHGTLNTLGLQQAEEAAVSLKKYRFSRIYSSDLRRCADTAKIIKKALTSTPLTLTKELRELNMGEFQGKGWGEVDWDRLGNDLMNRKPKNGESLSELRKRIIRFINKLSKLHQNDQILFVTHAGVIRQIISHYEQLPTEYVYKKILIKNGLILKLEIDNKDGGKVLNLPKPQAAVATNIFQNNKP